MIRLAHHHSNASDDHDASYNDQPHASLSYDGKWASFTNNYDGVGSSVHRDVFVVRMPTMCR